MTLHAAFRWFSFAASKDQLVWVETTPTECGVIRAMDLHTRKTRGLYDLNATNPGLQLGEQSVIHWRNNRGDDVDGILIKPRDIKTYSGTPLIVDPYSRLSNGFFSGIFLAGQLIATQGYVVLLPNCRVPHHFDYFKGEPTLRIAGKHTLNIWIQAAT